MNSNDQGLNTGCQAPFDPASDGWESISGDGFMGLVGPIWRKCDENGLRFGFLADEKHRNRRGVVHGGMVMTFADQALGMTARDATDEKPQATIQLDVHFVDAIRIGEFVEVGAQIVRRTKSVIFMKGDLVVGTRVVATANGIWKVLAGGTKGGETAEKRQGPSRNRLGTKPGNA